MFSFVGFYMTLPRVKSLLREHKFKYNFQSYINPPICSCGSGIELTSHFLLHCPIFNDKRHNLLSTLNNIDCKILESTDSYLTQTFLYSCILYVNFQCQYIYTLSKTTLFII